MVKKSSCHEKELCIHEVCWYVLLGFGNIPHCSRLKLSRISFWSQNVQGMKSNCVHDLCWYGFRITECSIFFLTLFTFEVSWNINLVSKTSRHEKEIWIHEFCWYLLLGFRNVAVPFPVIIYLIWIIRTPRSHWVTLIVEKHVGSDGGCEDPRDKVPLWRSRGLQCRRDRGDCPAVLARERSFLLNLWISCFLYQRIN